ncbi:MAG: alpha/beta fold hydrolase [Microthrixaceae bacterium]|nr:alpha/beta fold hydrolase [Microthrixaceae bacterium]
MASVVPGAEPLSVTGGDFGVLVLHGFTGSPTSVRGLAEAFAARGHSVEMPLLPGHGTHIHDMVDTTWADWSSAAEEGLARLRAHTRNQVVAGLSMGGAIACWLAVGHPDLAGLICINPPIDIPAEHSEALRGLLGAGVTVLEGSGSDIADPEAVDFAYPDTPLAPLLTMLEAAGDLTSRLHRISQPLLLVNSINDHVVPPENSDRLAAAVSGPVERLELHRSYHVATVDYDRDILERRCVEFVDRLSGDPGPAPGAS